MELDYENDFCPITTYIRAYKLYDKTTYKRLLKLALEANLEFIRVGIHQQYRFKNLPSIVLPDISLSTSVRTYSKADKPSELVEGYLYLLKLYDNNADFLGVCKFGISSRVDRRLRDLNNSIREHDHYYSLHSKSKVLDKPLDYETVILRYCKLRGKSISDTKYGSVKEVFIYEEWMDNLVPQ